MSWSFDQTTPIYVQIADRMRERIVRGEYKGGERLPPVREQSLESSANPNTVQRAYSMLENEELVVTEGTQGRRVTDREDVINAARQKMVDALVKDFVMRLSSLGYSAADCAELISKQKSLKEENCNAEHDS